MKLLLFDFGAYTGNDMQETLRGMGISFRTVSYHFRNQYEDAFFSRRLREYLREGQYDALLSVNYHPLVARACYDENIKYLSWSYDTPLNIVHIEDTLDYPTNYAFFFDRNQCLQYRREGFERVYHLPLAVNTDRLDNMTVSLEEQKRYGAQISFVGKLYDSLYHAFTEALPQEDRELFDAVINTQLVTYDRYIIDDVANDEMTEGLNAFYRRLQPDTEFVLSKEALAYALASQVTRTERILLLDRLSRQHDVKLYSREEHPLLQHTKYCGSAGYLLEMPKVFRCSQINLNITFRMIQTGIPLRALDIMGAGGFLLTNYQEEIAEHFEDGREAAIYHSMEEAVEKAEYYLRHEEQRRKIAQKGHQAVRENFSYRQRIEQMLETAGVGR